MVVHCHKHAARDDVLIDEHVQRLVDKAIESEHIAGLRLEELRDGRLQASDANGYTDLHGAQERQRGVNQRLALDARWREGLELDFARYGGYAARV